MKKVLILAYDFPPYVSVGGIRPYSWYKYFKEFYIEPVVITRQWENTYGNKLDYIAASKTKETEVEVTKFGKIIRTPYFPNLANKILLKYGDKKYTFLRKATSGFYELFQWFFPFGTKFQIYLEAKKYLVKNDVDLIIATGDPFILFKYASDLSNEFDVPWIADYRDPWIQDKSRNSKRLSKTIEMFFEKKYVKTAASIVTVSTFIENLIKANRLSNRVSIVPNGYDEIDLLDSRLDSDERILKIAFSGSIYPWHPIEKFLKGINKLTKTENANKIQIHFYGINDEDYIEKLIIKINRNLQDHIYFYPKISNEDLLKELVKHNCFLLFNDYSILGTKIFNYLYLRKKILFCFSNDPEAKKLKTEFYNVDEIEGESQHLQEDLILYTNSGIVVKNSNHLQEVLIDLQQEINQNGYISCDSKNIEQFSRKKQVEKLAKIIERDA